MSDARYQVSPSVPSTMGAIRLKPTSTPGSSTLVTTKDIAPRMRAAIAATACAREAPPRISTSTKCAMTSVSVSEEKTCPLPSSSSFSPR